MMVTSYLLLLRSSRVWWWLRNWIVKR